MQTFDSFGDWVRRRRKALDLTQADLAGRVGCALVTLKKIELDERRPSRPMAERMAQCLELSPAEVSAFLAVAARRRAPDVLPQSHDPIKAHGNLPAPVASLVGREAELAAIIESLGRGGARLLTLTGPVGVGKTRLAIEAGWRMQPNFMDGVFLVSLGAVQDARQVPMAAAAALQVKEGRGRNMARSVADHLSRKDMLLVFDSFEHLQSAAIFLADLLAAAPRLRLLVTSRTCLHLYGEHELVVQPLPLPELNSPSIEAAAVRLFCERAQAARSDFRLTPDYYPVVVDIVRRLDGLPLAIELAAARIKHFSLAELQQRLERRLPLLGGGPTDLPPRLQGLEKAIAWSYELLPSSQRTLLNRAAVFVGSFSISAAEAVCQFPNDQLIFSTGKVVSMALSGIAGGLADLLDQSLLMRQEGLDGVRFQMLNIIREYVLEKLRESSELELIQQRHAEYFGMWAEEAERQLWGAEQADWLERIERSSGNLLAALTWFLSTDQAEWAARLAAALGVYWRRRSRFSEGRIWLERVLQQQGCLDVDEIYRARTLQTVATLAYRQGDWAPAQKWLNQCLPMFQAADDRAGIARVLYDLGWIAIELANWSEAIRLNRESLAISRELDNPWGIYKVLTNLGWTYLCIGERQPAAEHFEQAFTIAQELGHTRGLAVSLANLAWIALYQSDLEQAASRALESLRLCHRLGEKEVFAECLEILAITAENSGEHERAAELGGASQALWEELHISRPLTQHSAAAHRSAMDATRRMIPDEIFSAYFQAGRAMSLDAMAAYALEAASGS